MKNNLDEEKPIFLQIKEQIEDSIMNGSVSRDERVPSTNEFAGYYKINPATAAKGINELVSEGILAKQRGVGMFVTEDARDILIQKRKNVFYESYVIPLKSEAEKLNIGTGEIIEMVKGETRNED